MKSLRNLCIVLALVLSHAMCAVVAYAYRGMQCGIAHLGFSAPADVALWYAVPFAAGILLCVGLAYRFHRQSRQRTFGRKR